jgi:hypothetical protein
MSFALPLEELTGAKLGPVNAAVVSFFRVVDWLKTAKNCLSLPHMSISIELYMIGRLSSQPCHIFSVGSNVQSNSAERFRIKIAPELHFTTQ